MAENEKQTNKERLKDITDSIERGIQELFQSDKYAEYLRTMSRFHKYSVNNTMLICLAVKTGVQKIVQHILTRQTKPSSFMSRWTVLWFRRKLRL